MADFNVNFSLDDQTLVLHDTSVARAEEAADRAETAAATLTVDSAMSSSSTNPVQNKVINGEITNLKQDIIDIASGDITWMLKTGAFWTATGTKSTSSSGQCTDPIYVPSGWHLIVSAGIGTSGASITEVTSEDTYVSTVVVGASINYDVCPSEDKYYSVSYVPNTVSFVPTKILLLKDYLSIDRGKSYTFMQSPCRNAIVRSTGVIDTSSGAFVADFAVKAGEIVKAYVKISSSAYAIYFMYDDGTTDGVLGSSSSTYKNYSATAKNDGRAYITTLKETSSLSGSVEVVPYSDSMSAKIFKRVCCCGDSYTSGYTVDEDENIYRINEQFAWPHYVETQTGNEWINCGASGTSAKTWLTNVRGLQKAKAYGKVQAYVIGLMINDSSDTERHVDVGTASDIGTSADTYYAYYSQIIRELASISPDAHIFALTCPREAGESTRFHPYNVAVRTICDTYKNIYNVHLLDLYAYRSYYNAEVFTSDAWYSHYTAVGYEYMAETFIKILSLYIDINQDIFKYVALIPYDSLPELEEVETVVSLYSPTAISAYSGTYLSNEGYYAQIDSKVYFYASIKALKAISSGINNVLPNLPVPASSDVLFYEYDVFGNRTENYISYSSGNGWRHNGEMAIGDLVTICGVYAVT